MRLSSHSYIWCSASYPHGSGQWQRPAGQGRKKEQGRNGRPGEELSTARET
jgi:hypothetical protein